MSDQLRRRELAEFLRSRRARMTPESVGLIRGFHRRTPGLRREEVAELAGLGLAWYTWLEQGRDINVSDDVVASIARALRLTPDERDHLFVLARRAKAEHGSARTPRGVCPRDQAVLDALDPTPAYIRDDCWNLLAYNKAFAQATTFDEVPERERNLIWLLFMHPNPRRLSLDWEEDARLGVGQYRFDATRYLNEPETIELIERLRGASPEFRELWSYHDVFSGVGTRTTWRHPKAGNLHLERCSMALSGPTSAYTGPRQRLNVFVPVPGTDTENHLTMLTETA